MEALGARTVRLDLWRHWRADRLRREQASRFVDALLADPPASDVRWLADLAAGGDQDHALWELRYARRAGGLLVAQRDALDDRTASLVSAALGRAWRRDSRVARNRREVATRQFNARLAAYGDALSARGGSEGTSARLGRVLLGFAGRLDPSAAELSEAGQCLAGYLKESSDALREIYGGAVFDA